MPLIKARSSSIINDVGLRGTPTSPTATKGTTTTQIASTAFVTGAVSDLINASPAVLDTLSELAAAINNDDSFATTVANSIATKVTRAGDTLTGFLTLHADPSSSMHAATKNYVDDQINSQMIYSTDDVSEGSLNLYYTDDRVRGSITVQSNNTAVLDYNSTTGVLSFNHPTSDGVLEGTVNLYYTDTRVRNAISLTSDDNQILGYGASTGAFTFTTPDTDKIVEGSTNQYFTTARARASVNNGANIDYDSATGTISTQAAVWSVNTQTGDVALDTDDISEGTTNLYFTNGRVGSAISLTTDNSNILSYVQGTGAFTFVTPSTDAISEGSTNQYFTNTRARSAISVSSDFANVSYDSATGVITVVAPDTDDVPEGTTNVYFTETRARNAISLTSDNQDVLSYDTATGEFTFSLGSQNTDDVAEGSTNLYHTTARARASISVAAGWSLLSYDSTSGQLTLTTPDTDDVIEGSTNQYFTQTRARNAVSATQTSGDGTFSYDNTTGVFTFVGSDDADYRGAVSAVRASGDGDLQYDSATGVFTYTGPSAADTRAHFSAATTGTGHGNLSYDSATGAFTYAKVTSANVRGEISATTASGVTYTAATGVIALASVPNGSLANSSITINGATIALGASDTLDSDDIAEGVTNNYWTQARFDTALAASDTDDLAEGANNLYYTQTRFNSAFAAKTTTDLAEGTNEYFTQARARNSLVAGTGVTYTAGTGTIAIGQSVGTTDNVTFNDMTVSGDLTVLGTLTSIQSTNVEINDVNLTLAKGAANAAAANGAGLTIDGANATLTYESGTDTWNFNKSVVTTGSVTADSITTTGATGFVGNLTGDVTGDLTGDVTGNVTGNLTGNVTSTGTSTFSTVDINGGQIDGTVIGGVTPAAITGTTITATSSLTAPTFIGDLTGDVTGNVTGDLTGNVTGNVTGQVSDISNHDTDALDEGTTNLYYTDTRSRAALSGGNTGTGHGSLSYNSGTGAFTFAKVTASNIRGELSANKVSGDGNFSYDSATGVFSYTGPSAADARAHFSATTASGVTYDQATGVFALASIPNASLANSSITVNSMNVALGGSINLTTDYVNEGATNQYFLDSRARNAISLTTSDASTLSYDPATGAFAFSLAGIDTDEVAEGSANLYYTDTRARASISASSNWSNVSYDPATGVISVTAPDTDDVPEGATNQYFTQTRARTSVSLTSDNQSVLSYDNTTGAFTFSLSSTTTDAVTEGSTNLYHTTARARNAISNGSNIAYDASTGVISTQAAVWSVNTQTHDVVLDTDDISEGTTNLYFTSARAQNALTVVSDDANILSYATGTLTFVTPDTDAIAEGAVNLYYTDARADGRIGNASVFDLSDVDLGGNTLTDGYTLVWSSAQQNFVPQNIAVTATTLNFTGDGTTTSFSCGVEVSSIDNTQVYINGLIQAPTFSYTLSTVSSVSSIVFDQAPEASDYIYVRVSSTSSLTAGGVLNESSMIDGGTY